MKEGKILIMKISITKSPDVGKNEVFLKTFVKPVLRLFLLANMINLLVEMLSRRSFVEGLLYMVSNPLVFEYNVLIILLTLSVAFLCRRKTFIMAIVASTWLGLGVANSILLGFRATPLAAIDFALLKSVWSIMGVYLTLWQVIFIFLLFAAVVAIMIFVWRRAPKQKVTKTRPAAFVFTAVLAGVFITVFSANAQAISQNFGNLAEAYENYGFAYCFSSSFIDRGIDKPEDYSSETIDKILADIETENDKTTDLQTNIIMVQLESFFDVNNLQNLTYSENPVPVFSQLKKEYSSGFLTVPSIGAGTANTEFEVLTGMSLDFFGTGEYPYRTVLPDTTCESVNYDLKELGYICHAIHNHSGTFYDRNKVYSQLGFDTFTSLEYMDQVEYNSLGWAKDYVLTPEILKTLASTAGLDFIYTISVQAHGKYPTDAADEIQTLTVSGFEDETKHNKFEYYINQIHETDQFIGRLLDSLASYDELVVVVLFGDHLPSLEIEEDDLSAGNLFQVEYVIWSNFDLAKTDCDMSAYQLSAYVMGRLGFDNGLLTKLHQQYVDNPDYLAALEMLEYDMLYGSRFVYGGVNPYRSTNMRMGTTKICITGIQPIKNSFYVFGKGFTEWSVVCLNGHYTETVYIDEDTLLVKDEGIYPNSVVTVAQIGDDKEVLSVTNKYLWP